MCKKLYDKTDDGEIFLYTVKSGKVEADICDLGARINAIRVNGIDIVLGFNCVKDYLQSECYAGATVGRVANRIAGGRYVFNGNTYFLNKNDGENHLHGGNTGFDKKLFTVLNHDAHSITMQYISEDGEENYPGTLKIIVKFSICDNSLLIEYEAVSDKDTLWCPTNHAYFNLDGENSGDCRNNLLRINADYYTPTDVKLIPTGEKKGVSGTPLNFNSLKRIGEDFGSEELKSTNGYDHNYLLNGEYAARAESATTGISLEVYTDMPCMQFYTGGALKPCKGKTRDYNEWAGFCLEPQYCPNAINTEGFAQPVLKKNEIKKHYIKFKF